MKEYQVKKHNLTENTFSLRLSGEVNLTINLNIERINTELLEKLVKGAVVLVEGVSGDEPADLSNSGAKRIYVKVNEAKYQPLYISVFHR